MKTTYLFTSAFALLVSLATSAHGASLSFVPAGSQLDLDSIVDLGVNVGDNVDLSFFLDTTGLSANLQSIDIRVDQDLTESSLTASRTEADELTFPIFDFGGSPQDSGLFSAVFLRDGVPGLAPDSTIELVTGSLEILPGLQNDGLVDFAVTVVSAIDANGIDVTNLFQPSTQSFDLQQSIPESTSIPSLLGLGLLGISSLVWRKKI